MYWSVCLYARLMKPSSLLCSCGGRTARWSAGEWGEAPRATAVGGESGESQRLSPAAAQARPPRSSRPCPPPRAPAVCRAGRCRPARSSHLAPSSTAATPARSGCASRATTSKAALRTSQGGTRQVSVAAGAAEDATPALETWRSAAAAVSLCVSPQLPPQVLLAPPHWPKRPAETASARRLSDCGSGWWPGVALMPRWVTNTPATGGPTHLQVPPERKAPALPLRR